MTKTLTPTAQFIAWVVLGILAVALVVLLSTRVPWLGVYLVKKDNFLIIESISKDSDLLISKDLDLKDLRLVGLRADGVVLELTAEDIIEEPDTLLEPERVRAFFDRQAELAEAARSASLTLIVSDQTPISAVSEDNLEIEVRPALSRPVSSLPVLFWVQAFVALASAAIIGWLVSVRRQEPTVRLLSLAGVGLSMSSLAAALYGTRELALPDPLFRYASAANFTGAMLFGVGMVSLFLVYPRRLASNRVCLVVGGILLVFPASVIFDGPEVLQYRQATIGVTILLLLVIILVQVWVTRKSPIERAILGWFGLSVVAASGCFGLAVTLPSLLGGEPSIPQGYAFLFFLLIFVGIAAGVARYRLFDIPQLAFRTLFYVCGVGALLFLDAFLIYAVALDRLPALTVSFAAVAFLYLPLRDSFERRLRSAPGRPIEDLFAMLSDVVLASSPDDRSRALQTLIDALFQPLSTVIIPQPENPVTLIGDGEALELRMPTGLPSLRLNWASVGSRLFSQVDVALAHKIIGMLALAIEKQEKYDTAVEHERLRINRDLHDHVGVQLIAALHTSDAVKKRTLIEDALQDLRHLVTVSNDVCQPLREIIADLRYETANYLEAASLQLIWRDEAIVERHVKSHTVRMLRGVLRELVANAVKHAQAQTVQVCWQVDSENLILEVCDDGVGFDPKATVRGSGLKNFNQRLAALHGQLDLVSSPAGTCVTLRFPFQSLDFDAAKDGGHSEGLAS